jgi:hypothetical protein
MVKAMNQWIPTAFNQGEDAKHIKVNEKGLLQIDENYSPSDTYRWRLLKEVIDSGEKVTIKGLASGGPTYLFHTQGLEQGAQIKPVLTHDYISREPALTVVSKKLFKKVWGDLVTPTIQTGKDDPNLKYRGGMTSESENISFIYFENGFPLESITHELLGHFYLATRGVPFKHDDFKDRFTLADADKITVEFKLTAQHNILDREGKVFEGRVWDFIKQVEGK